ncbi:serine hydrolase domain-containing protein [Clostridium algidicarnis]|uniref:serine hydrolase domain-containing protein n=1 Tax=Clostridium algidicarnis TaxID=37659 RepID=UPI003FD8D318
MEQLSNLMEKLINNDKFSGVLVINKDNKEIFSESYGYAHRGWKIKNTINTKFAVASITKIFTAVSLLQLIEKGLLDFNTKVTDILDINDSKISSNINIEQLLTHTSGIADYFNEDEDGAEAIEEIWKDTPNYSIKDLKDLLPMFIYTDSLSNPGEKFSYCNGGYILLGLIIEKISGISYFEYITNNIFKKIGMYDSAFIPLNHSEENVAEGYIRVENEIDGTTTWKTNVYSIAAYGASDGGAFTTANDLTLFFRALKNSELLSDEMTKLILEPKVIEDEDEDYTWHYGYGMWFISKDDKVVRIALTGEDPGVSARLFYYPEQDVEVIILGNQSDVASSLGWYIHDNIIVNL